MNRLKFYLLFFLFSPLGITTLWKWPTEHQWRTIWETTPEYWNVSRPTYFQDSHFCCVPSTATWPSYSCKLFIPVETLVHLTYIPHLSLWYPRQEVPVCLSISQSVSPFFFVRATPLILLNRILLNFVVMKEMMSRWAHSQEIRIQFFHGSNSPLIPYRTKKFGQN